MKKLSRTIISVMLSCLLFTITAYAKPEWPSDTGIVAEGGIVMDADSGAMIFGQNSRVAYPPASITKLLTALVVLENASLDEIVTFSNDAVNNVESGSGNQLNLAVGDQLSVEECLYALLLRSSNQSANALAEHVAGSRDGFVTMMNEKIEEIGCTGSQFRNPSGLNDEEQFVTPYDMALIAKAAFENEELLKISSTKKHTFPPTIENPEGITVPMKHRLLETEDSSSEYYFPDAVAGKIGYTSIAGNTLVTYAERDNQRLITVILKGGQPQYYKDGMTLLEFGFQRFQTMDVSDQIADYVTGDTDITIGSETYKRSDLSIMEPAVITLPNEAGYEDADMSLEAELPKGHPEGAVGVLRYTYNDRKIGEIYLCLKGEAIAETTEASTEEMTQAETLPEEETQPVETAGEPEPPASEADGRNASVTKILGVVVTVIIILILLMGVYLYFEKKREEKQRALRRERRRQRLMEDGDSEEAFERFLEEQKNQK